MADIKLEKITEVVDFKVTFSSLAKYLNVILYLQEPCLIGKVYDYCDMYVQRSCSATSYLLDGILNEISSTGVKCCQRT